MLDHIGLNVPDLTLAKHYYDAIMPSLASNHSSQQPKSSPISLHEANRGRGSSTPLHRKVPTCASMWSCNTLHSAPERGTGR